MPPDYFTLVLLSEAGDSMIKSVWLAVVIAIGFALSGCNGSGSNQPVQPDKAGQKNILNDMAKNKELALKFLQGAQNSDKAAMYEAANLTMAMVNDSRDKLVYAAKYTQTENQRKANEEVLRSSGQIDYFSGMLKKLFPKSASFQITRSDVREAAAGIKRVDHTVTITYSDRKEALSDKTGKQVKTMIVHLLQTTSSVEDRLIHSFSFDSKGFDSYTDKDFEVLSYY